MSKLRFDDPKNAVQAIAWKIEDMWSNICCPFRKTWRWLDKLCGYAKLLWNDYDWDYSSILRLLQYKIQRTSDFIEKNGWNADKEKLIKEMRATIFQLQQLLDDEFLKEEHDAHIEKWGKIQWNSKPSEGHPGYYEVNITHEKVKTKEDKEQERQEFRALIEKEEKVRTKAFIDTFKSIGENMRKWWD